MRFTLKVRRVGHSLAILLPKPVVIAMNLQLGDRLQLITHPDGARLSPYDPQFANAMKQFESTRRWYRTALHALSKSSVLHARG